MLTGVKTAEAYPERLRRVRFYDADQDRTLIFRNSSPYPVWRRAERAR
jgi:hypothetical protein